MEGIIIKVYKDGKKIKEVSYPSGLRKTWDDDAEDSLASN